MADVPDQQLATELRELGAWLEVPEPPELRAAVRSRLTAPTTTDRAVRPAWRRIGPAWRRRLAAVAVAAAVTTGVLAVPDARAAVTDAVTGLLRFAGIELHRDPAGRGSLPSPLPSPAPLPSARTVTLDEARRVAPFPIRVPAALGAPERVEISDPAPDGAPRLVTMFYRGGTVRLDQFDGELEPGFAKVVPNMEWAQLPGGYAVWLPTPHPLVYVDRQGERHESGARLAGPTLIWSDAGVARRLEGIATRAEALAVAGSLR